MAANKASSSVPPKNEAAEMLWKDVLEWATEVARGVPADMREPARVKFFMTAVKTEQTAYHAKRARDFFLDILRLGAEFFTEFASAMTIPRLHQLKGKCQPEDVLRVFARNKNNAVLKSKGVRDSCKRYGIYKLYGKQSRSFHEVKC